MTMQTIRELQAYGYIAFIGVLCVLLYSYVYHLYHSEKTKRRNYEQYSNLALNDEFDDAVLEQRRA